ncbi:hypothetical protein RUM43_005864 [Polyplax serrata]|uniref:Uncharacterized protein n=1 Tax=Polyplax serrata TaxID=468196 RepID=A0AAN8PBT8_POLSC
MKTPSYQHGEPAAWHRGSQRENKKKKGSRETKSKTSHEPPQPGVTENPARYNQTIKLLAQRGGITNTRGLNYPKYSLVHHTYISDTIATTGRSTVALQHDRYEAQPCEGREDRSPGEAPPTWPSRAEKDIIVRIGSHPNPGESATSRHKGIAFTPGATGTPRHPHEAGTGSVAVEQGLRRRHFVKMVRTKKKREIKPNTTTKRLSRATVLGTVVIRKKATSSRNSPRCPEIFSLVSWVITLQPQTTTTTSTSTDSFEFSDIPGYHRHRDTTQQQHYFSMKSSYPVR